MVYNQEKYLKRCLDGFVNQKTNFPFEIVVHDDCSTDKSKSIITSYANNYPDLFVTIFETENKFSQNVNILDNIMLPASSGRYIALCEGDDYWIDDHKLQKQFDIMEADNTISLSAHNTIIHDLSGKQNDSLFNHWKKIRALSDEEIFMNWEIHTSSYFYKRDVCTYPSNMKPIWCGDYARLLLARSKGKIVCLPDVMSVYNCNNTNGLTWQLNNLEISEKKESERQKFLSDFDEMTNNKFHSICNHRIDKIFFYNDWSCIIRHAHKWTRRTYLKNIVIMLENERCRRYFDSLKTYEKIVWKLKMSIGYYIYHKRYIYDTNH